MDDDFSIESIYEKGLGISVDGIFQNTELSVEDYDNSIEYEIAGMKSLIDSMELYMNMTELNKAQKIQMAHRINTNYGYYNRSLENYCEKLIHSTEDDGKDNENKKEEEKKPNIFKRFFSMIGRFFKKIFKAIQRAFTRIIEWITGKSKSFDKKRKEDEERDKLHEEKKNKLIKKRHSDKLNNELNEIIDIAKQFQNEFHSLEPLHLKFSNNLEKFQEIKVNDEDKYKDESMKCLKTFQKQCKIVSIYYQLLLSASHKIINYIKQYYNEVDNAEGMVNFYCKPNVAKIKELGRDFSNVLSHLNRIIEYISTNRLDNNNQYKSVDYDWGGVQYKGHGQFKNTISETKNERLLDAIRSANEDITSFIRQINHQYIPETYGYEKDSIDYLLDRTDKQLTAIEKIKNNGIDYFLKAFGIVAHYDAEHILD